MKKGLEGAIMSGDTKAAAEIIKTRGIRTGKGMGVLKGLVTRRNAEAALFQNGQLP